MPAWGDVAARGAPRRSEDLSPLGSAVVGSLKPCAGGRVAHPVLITMKALLALGLAALALSPAQAQIFGPRSVDGALLGGIAGAVIGHNSGSLSHNGWQGAAIGAGVGALLGASADYNAARYDTGVPVSRGGYIYRNSPVRYGGYYGGSAAADGLWLGALAGGIIGHNRGFSHGRNGWRGAAWGAGAGWLLGSLIDSNRYYNTGYDYDYGYGYPRTVVMPQSQPVFVQSAPAAAAPQQVTIINNYYGNAAPMASANAMFGR